MRFSRAQNDGIRYIVGLDMGLTKSGNLEREYTKPAMAGGVHTLLLSFEYMDWGPSSLHIGWHIRTNIEAALTVTNCPDLLIFSVAPGCGSFCRRGKYVF